MNVPVQVIKYDISSMNPAYVDYIQSEKDNDTRKFRVKFYSHDTLITLSNSCTATATITIDNVMIEQELVCTITDNSVEVTANATRDGVMAIQITLTDGDDKLTMQRPIFIRVTNDIAETAQIDDDSHGSYAEVVQEIADSRGDYISLSEALNHKLSSAEGAVKTANIDTGAVTEAKLATAFKDTLYRMDTETRNVGFSGSNPKTIYLNAVINDSSAFNGQRGIIITSAENSFQFFFGRNKSLLARYKSSENAYSPWEDVCQGFEKSSNKKTAINSSNQASTAFFPSIKAVVDYIAALFATVINNDNKSSNALLPTIKAVVDYLTANYIGNGSGTVTENNLAAALKNSLYRVDNTTENVIYSADNPRIIYTNARVNGNKPTLIFTLGDGSQLAMHKDGHLYCRTFANGAYGDWIDLKAMSITESNKTSDAYPTVRAVYNFVTAFVASAISGKADTTYVDNRLNSKADTTYVDNRLNTKADSSALTAKEDLSNKIITGENLYNNKNSTDKYPAAKAIVDYIAALFATAINNDNKSSNALLPTIKAVVDYLTENYTNTTTMNERLSRKMDTAYAEDLRYKVNELSISIEPDPEDGEYPSAYAVWMIANEVYNDLSLDISTKEDLSNKIPNRTAMDNLNSETQYPSIKTMVQYTDEKAFQVLGEVSDVKAYIGYTESDILGLCVDLENNRFARLAGAEELEAGSDFDAFPMFGGRRRCCVANDGTINAYYGEQGYAEDGTNGQIMVYQPKFYYRMVPLKLEKQASGLGYHIRKANYYVTANPHPGFKLHPLFYDANGNEVDYVLLSAYEGSMYDVSESAYANDSVDTSVSYGAGDLLCSVAGKKPISGKLDGVGSKAQFETMANNIGPGWHLNTIKAENANQLLMMIELGTLNMQTAVGRGVVDQSGSSNASSLTGSTASLGNATGMASSTIAESAGTETTNTTNGKLSVSYRGVENPWGNIWEHTNGINLWGDGTMGGGQVFICDDFTYNESKHDGNYQSAGFSVADAGGYVSAFGYGSEDYDWVLMPSETAGNSSLPVGDNFWCTSNLNGYRIAQMSGYWLNGDSAGGFCSHCSNGPGTRYYAVGGRLLYVPTASV